ncbi:MAG: peptide chain release factor 1 [Candidatus Cloacimonetes bacterium]|nr:peptide chain release factor 1 [Candidatus Cloacimonadota bacterium]
MIPIDKINSLKNEYDILRDRISDLTEMNDRKEYKKINRRFNELQNILNTYQSIESIKIQLEQTKSMIFNEIDQDMVNLAKEEYELLENNLEEITQNLKNLLAPQDPNDEKNAIIEIRAGTGGEEAALFVAALNRMYTRFCELKGWKKSIISFNETGRGGFREISFSLEGDNVYGTMRFESGVHRVQRVPETEANGRIHTSAISVAVLPEADEIDVQINENDLKVDIYKAQGAGGQHVNTTDSAVRITHLPTNIVVTCQDERSQIKNRAKAMEVLRSKLLDLEISKQESEIASSRKSQVGTGDRSAKIRTYNYPQSRITDHRINLTTHNLSGMLDGELDEFIDALKIAYKNERLGT